MTTAGPPAPVDARLRLVNVPAATIAALRYNGVAGSEKRVAKEAEMMAMMAKSAWHVDEAPYTLNYDPPFAIPFLRRNKGAVRVKR